MRSSGHDPGAEGAFEAQEVAVSVSEKHELLEFRRIAGFLYQKNAKWTKSVELSKKDGLYKDAMEAAAQSGDKDIAGDLLQFFIEQENKECFAAMLYNCYDLRKPDEVLEIAWMKGLMEYAMPYMIQVMKDYTNKVDVLVEDKKDRNKEKADYQTTHTDYSESIDAVARALVVLKQQAHDRKQAGAALLQAPGTRSGAPRRLERAARRGPGEAPARGRG